MDISIGPDTVALVDRYVGVGDSEGLATGELCDIADDIARAIRGARTRAAHGAHSVGGLSTRSSAASVSHPAEAGTG